MPRDVVLHGALLEGTGTQMDKPPGLFRYEPSGRGICVVTILASSGALSTRFRVSVLFSAPRARSAALLARVCMTSAG